MRRPSSRTGLLAFALLAILVATLWPVYEARPQTWVSCIVCGEHGVADVLLNIVLFLPLGVALGLGGRRIPQCVLLAALLSASIELAQLLIPGRDASLGDVVSNTIGATLGAMLVRTAPAWLLPPPERSTRLSRVAALAAAALCCVTGLLLAPVFPDSLYYGQWTPNLGHLEWYRGRVLDATIGALHVAPGPMSDTPLARELLRSASGCSLHVRGIAGPRPAELASLFSISDDRQREIILLGPDRDDLVFRFRTRAAALRLDQPDIRVTDAMEGMRAGDSLDVTVTREGRACRVALNGRTAAGLGPTVGSGWGLLMYPEALPAVLKGLLSAVWVGALFLPAAFWIRTRGEAVWVTAALVAGLVGAPALTPLVATPAIQWAAAALGLLTGAGLRVVVARRIRGGEAQRPRITSAVS
ncbi:MAG TPA: VanZ family protein [Gemmatimonadales bacterium]|nr:VanZ family protein [Gemmatimonadales bacterium]